MWFDNFSQKGDVTLKSRSYDNYYRALHWSMYWINLWSYPAFRQTEKVQTFLYTIAAVVLTTSKDKWCQITLNCSLNWVPRDAGSEGAWGSPSRFGQIGQPYRNQRGRGVILCPPYVQIFRHHSQLQPQLRPFTRISHPQMESKVPYNNMGPRWFSVGICTYKPGYKSHDLL